MPLRNARREDLAAISAIYKAVIGTKGCSWNEYYPGEEELRHDFETGNLYVFEENVDMGNVSMENGRVVGAVSRTPENELDGLPFWRICDGTQAEIARVAITPERQGKGLASEMLTALFARLARNGCGAVHLLAAKKNESAVRLYRSLGFEFRGETAMYGNDYYACEKALAHCIRNENAENAE